MKMIRKMFSFLKNKYLNQVSTSSGKTCQFPFDYNGISYKTCTVQGPNNPTYLPQCMTASGGWDFCNGKQKN
jgi:hypothetical protein